MPTVLRIDGLRVVVYPNDHRPAHVHVIGADGEAVFVLAVAGNPPVLRESFGFGVAALRRIERVLTAHAPTLLAHWENIHAKN